MSIHDVSRPLRDGMPVWPGDPPVALVPWTSIDEAGYRLHELRVGEHTGTHLGAPSHYVPGGASLDQLDVAHFVGHGLVVDGRAGRDVTALTAGLDVPDRERCTHLLFDHGDDEGPAKPGDTAAGLTLECLLTATDALPELRCIGTTRDNLDPGNDLAVGTQAAAQGLSHLESLRGLAGVPRGRLLEVFVGCPMVIGATGMPCRVLVRG